jgi:aryl-alcohol dehydrogenase-like predicted oxidoreductase
LNRVAQPAAAAGTALLRPQPVARVGAGAMQLPRLDRRSAITLFRRAAALSVNHIDTASYHGPARANEFIRPALHPYPGGLVIITKVGYRLSERGGLVPAQAPSQLRPGVQADLRSLEIPQLPVVNLRLEDPPGAIDPERVNFDDQLAEMAARRDEGLGQAAATTANPAKRAMNASWCRRFPNHRSLADLAGSQTTPPVANQPQEVQVARSLV